MRDYCIINSIVEDEWRSFVDEHPEGNIFHTPEMFWVFNRTRNYQPEIWAATHKRTIKALFFPVRVTLISQWVKLFTTRAISYGSVLYTKDEDGLIGLDTLLREYIRKTNFSILFTELRHLTDKQDIQDILLANKFCFEDNVNYLIDLNRSKEEIFQDIGPRTRKALRKAWNKNQVKIVQVTERRQISLIYRLLEMTYKRAGIPLADISLFEAAYDILFPKGMIMFTIAKVNDEPASVSVDLMYKKTIYGWFGGTDRKYTPYITNELITWYLFEWGATHGYHIYDFGGAGNPGEDYGVRTFKSKFGGALVNYGRNCCIHNPSLFKLSKKVYQSARKLLFGTGGK